MLHLQERKSAASNVTAIIESNRYESMTVWWRPVLTFLSPEARPSRGSSWTTRP
jgi:hypothetical protein